MYLLNIRRKHVAGGTISRKSVATAVVTLPNGSYAYTGVAISPTVTVRLDGALLSVNEDYTVAYVNNTDVGLATIVITGIGDFYGTATKEFYIVKGGGAGWRFDISKTSSTPSAVYEVVDFNGDSPRLAVFNGGFVSIPGRNGSFSRYELPSLDHASSDGLNNVSAGLSPDGIHFVFVQGDSNHVFAANASVPFDVSDLSFSGQGVYATISACTNLVISGDGLHVFMIGKFDYGLQGKIFRHDLSTAFDFSTMSAEHSETINFVGAATFGKYQDFCFAPNGMKMLWFDDKTAYVFDLSEAWNPSTATLSGSKTFDESISPPSVAVDEAGENLYIGGGGSLYVFSLTA